MPYNHEGIDSSAFSKYLKFVKLLGLLVDVPPHGLDSPCQLRQVPQHHLAFLLCNLKSRGYGSAFLSNLESAWIYKIKITSLVGRGEE